MKTNQRLDIKLIIDKSVTRTNQFHHLNKQKDVKYYREKMFDYIEAQTIPCLSQFIQRHITYR